MNAGSKADAVCCLYLPLQNGNAIEYVHDIAARSKDATFDVGHSRSLWSGCDSVMYSPITHMSFSYGLCSIGAWYLKCAGCWGGETTINMRGAGRT